MIKKPLVAWTYVLKKEQIQVECLSTASDIHVGRECWTNSRYTSRHCCEELAERNDVKNVIFHEEPPDDYYCTYSDVGTWDVD